MAQKRIGATNHAIQQFIKRWEPKKTFDEARAELEELLNNSYLEGKTPKGDPIRISGLRPEIRMVIKDFDTCATVLPAKFLNKDDVIFEEVWYKDSEWIDRALNPNKAQKDMQDAEERILQIEIERKSLADKRRELGFEKEKLIQLLSKLKKYAPVEEK